MISSWCSDSLDFRCLSSDRNSRLISEMMAMGEASVFLLLVAIVDPPRDVSSGIVMLSTGRNGGEDMMEGRDLVECRV